MLTKQINLETEIKDFGEQKTVTILVDASAICELCVLLVLLRDALVDMQEIAFHNFALYLQTTKENTSVCSLFDRRKKVMKATLSLHSLKYLLAFLLRYYRDGTAEVDHVDIDFDLEGEAIVTRTVKVDDYNTNLPGDMNKLKGTD